MSNEKLAFRYAKSLLDLAVEKEQLEAVHADIEYLAKSLKNRDLQLFIASPIIHSERKAAIFKEMFGKKLSVITNSFVDIVTSKHREYYLPEIVTAFIRQHKELQGVAVAKLTVASPVDDATLKQIREMVIQATGKKSVELQTVLDPSILGGFVLQYEGQQYDASIVSKLDTLRKEFMHNKYVREF